MSWDDLAAGRDCPFDQPRAEAKESWETVATLGVSTLCLMRNQAYRGHCILIYDERHATRPDQLSASEWADYSRDLHRAVCALREVCEPDHFNVEMLGNQMPHLHWHIVPRYRQDPRWGGPIWMTQAADMREEMLPEHERRALMAALRTALSLE